MAKRKANAEPKGRSRVAAKEAKAAGGTVYRLKITLDNIRPPIWRRVETKDCTLADLHDVIQDVMGWEDYHLHVFVIGDEEYGLPEQWRDGWSEVSSSRKVKLSHLAAKGVKKFRYTYDMGDDWHHTILLEKTLTAEDGVKYPRCVAGERAGPPEDCGGPWGYADLVQALEEPKTERQEELLEWAGDFHPDAFDLEAVNKQLRRG